MVNMVRMAAFFVGIILICAATAHAEPANFARVGKTNREPECTNGAFKSFGWAKSTAFRGMRDANLPGAPFIGKDAAWWMTYNKDALFITCLIALKPQGENFLAKATVNDDPAILEDDDHLLIQIGFGPKLGEGGVPFLRLAVNPNGAIWGATIEALPGQNHPIDTSRISVGNHVGSAHIPGHWWIMRLRIPNQLLGVENLDGKTAKMHLAWASKPLYLSWGGVKPDDWLNTPDVFFDSNPRASFRLNGASTKIMHTSGQASLDLLSGGYTGTQKNPLLLRFSMRNEVGGKTTWEKVWEKKKTEGDWTRVSGRQNIEGVSGRGNVLTMEATTSIDGKVQSLFRNVLPYTPKIKSVQAVIEKWVKRRAYEVKAKANYVFIYDPYSEQLDALVSTKLNTKLYTGAELSRAKEIAGSDNLRVSVFSPSGKKLATGNRKIVGFNGNVKIQLPKPIPEGNYKIHMELLNGDTVVDQDDKSMIRKKFEWEKNNIGKEKVIIPPWTSMKRKKTKGSALTCWGRTYTIQNNGLPSSMVSQGEDVLGGPMRLTGIVDGKALAAEGLKAPRITLIPGKKFPADFAQYELSSNSCPVAEKDFQLENTNGYAAEIEADSTVGPIGVSIKSRLDYDGLYTVNLTINPIRNVKVDSLTLTVPIAKSSNLYRFSRMLDMNCLGAIPTGDGILEKSSNLPRHLALTGTFVPVVFVGQYDHGFFWMAETDRGWSVDDTDDQVRLVRENNELALQFRFIAKPTLLNKPRTIEFAFMATPSRPKAPAYRQAFWQGKRTHDSSGFRFYGGGVNGFQLYTPEDYEGLRKFLYESNETAPHYRDAADIPPGHKSYYKVRNAMAKKGHPITLYGCSWGANKAMHAFPTFGGAWTHGSGSGRPSEGYKNYYNFGGTVKWTTPEQLTPVYTLMSDSFVDCWLWHMTRIGKFSGVNGCFFDCFESLPRALRGKIKTDIDGVAYRREDGQLRPFANPLRYHRRTRRFATAQWLAGRPPALLQSNNFDNTYGPTWYVEGAVYHKKIGQDLIAQGVTPDKVAAYTASCSGMGMCNSHVKVANLQKMSEAEEQCFKVILAYGMLYDIPFAGTPHWLSKTVKAVSAAKKNIDIGDPKVKHIRYWKPDSRLKSSNPKVLIGGFVDLKGHTALITVLNPTEETMKTTLSISTSFLGSTMTSVKDVLTDKPVKNLHNLKLESHEAKFLLIN